MENIIHYILIFFIGAIVGVVVSNIILLERADGVLRMKQVDHEEPYLFLELSNNVDKLFTKKYAMFKIDIRKYVSRE